MAPLQFLPPASDLSDNAALNNREANKAEDMDGNEIEDSSSLSTVAPHLFIYSISFRPTILLPSFRALSNLFGSDILRRVGPGRIILPLPPLSPPESIDRLQTERGKPRTSIALSLSPSLPPCVCVQAVISYESHLSLDICKSQLVCQYGWLCVNAFKNHQNKEEILSSL